MGGFTDTRGKFTISNLPVGTYTVRAMAIGFTKNTKAGVRVSADQTTIVEFTLARTPVTEPIPELQITESHIGLRVASIEPCPAPSMDTRAWPSVEQQRFTFKLPADFHEVKVEGEVDSWVRQFESADSAVFLTFDWGHYSSLLEEGEAGQIFRACSEEIGGRPARVITVWPIEGLPPGRFGAGTAWRDVKPGVHLTFFGWAPDSSGVMQLLAIFRTVRFEDSR